ncbi:MAG: HAD family hydrolase [bacterium]
MKNLSPLKSLNSFAQTCLLKVAVFLVLLPCLAWSEEALPSWNEGRTLTAIVDFVEKVTKPDSPDFIEPAERIAVFDNDGTLISEQPIYVQFAFAIDRIKELAPRHPEWRDKEPFKSVLEGRLKGLQSEGLDQAFSDLVRATCDGLTTSEIAEAATRWLQTARNAKTGRLQTEMAYRPMIELLEYLRSKGFKTFLVSGGGIEFMRSYTEKLYGIPSEQVVGSNVKMHFETREGTSELFLLPEVEFFNNGSGKPMGIYKNIGRRPVMAFGNSDGDLEMLQWTTSGPGPRFGAIIHHDDNERETAYDRNSLIGRLDKALDEAPARKWMIVSMKNDWKTVFSEEQIGIQQN